jgi:hypothetical protein
LLLVALTGGVKHCLDFSFYIFSSLTCPEKTCFQQARSSAVEGTSQAVLGSSDLRQVPASMTLFLKLKKPQLCYM